MRQGEEVEQGQEGQHRAEGEPMTAGKALQKPVWGSVLSPILAALCLLSCSSVALAVEAGPGWAIYSRAQPSNFSTVLASNGQAQVIRDGYLVMVRNLGSRPSDGGPVTISERVPAGLVVEGVVGYDIGPGYVSPEGGSHQEPVRMKCATEGQLASCTDEAPVPPGDTLYMSVIVRVSPSLKEGEEVTSTASVLGGGAASATTSLQTLISSAAAPFGWESFNAEATGVNGLTDTQAGDHPYEYTVRYTLTEPPNGEEQTGEGQKDIVVDLPPGFVGNPQVVQKCSIILADGDHCPASTQIGIATIEAPLRGNLVSRAQQGPGFVVPIYNVVPEKGVAAEFMFNVNPVPIFLYVNVSQDTNYGVRVTVAGIPRVAGVSGVMTTFFGEPLPK